MFSPTMETVFKDARIWGNQVLQERDLKPALARLTLYTVGGTECVKGFETLCDRN